MAKKGLYLAGGGARGAYQAGVLKAISNILNVKKIPFDIVSGVSVGSINAAVLAEGAADFPAATEKLLQLWNNLRCQQVFNATNYALGTSVLRNMGHLLFKQRQSGYLLDTAPLGELIANSVNFGLIESNIKRNYLQGVEIISNCYETQQTISFNQHNQAEFDEWIYPRHISHHVNLNKEHILASSALPLFFPSVAIDGLHFGDGSIGLVSPLRGTIRFKVDKILVLGTRQLAVSPSQDQPVNEEIGFARILGTMLNGLFLDNLDRDIEMVNRMNDISRLLSMWKKRHSPWRPITITHLRPTKDMAAIAQAQYSHMPGLLRFVLNALGAKSRSGDLLSFLLFEQGFTSELVKLGIADTMAIQDTIKEFFDD